MLYVLVCKPDGTVFGVKGPFAEEQTAEIYAAIEEIEGLYNLGTLITLCEGAKIRVMRMVYEKEEFL